VNCVSYFRFSFELILLFKFLVYVGNLPQFVSKFFFVFSLILEVFFSSGFDGASFLRNFFVFVVCGGFILLIIKILGLCIFFLVFGLVLLALVLEC